MPTDDNMISPAADARRPVRRCEADARRGTGTGTCGQPLDSHGLCPRVADHRD